MKVVWTATAIARLEAIEEHIAADDPGAAARFVDALIDLGVSLAEMPARGRAVPELPASGLRELIHRRYRLVYRVHGKRVDRRIGGQRRPVRHLPRGSAPGITRESGGRGAWHAARSALAAWASAANVRCRARRTS